MKKYRCNSSKKHKCLGWEGVASYDTWFKMFLTQLWQNWARQPHTETSTQKCKYIYISKRFYCPLSPRFIEILRLRTCLDFKYATVIFSWFCIIMMLMILYHRVLVNSFSSWSTQTAVLYFSELNSCTGYVSVAKSLLTFKSLRCFFCLFGFFLGNINSLSNIQRLVK